MILVHPTMYKYPLLWTASHSVIMKKFKSTLSRINKVIYKDMVTNNFLFERTHSLMFTLAVSGFEQLKTKLNKLAISLDLVKWDKIENSHTCLGDMNWIFLSVPSLFPFSECQRLISCFILQCSSSTKHSLSDRKRRRSYLKLSSSLFREAIRAVCDALRMSESWGKSIYIVLLHFNALYNNYELSSPRLNFVWEMTSRKTGCVK